MSDFCVCDYGDDEVDISRWENRRARKPWRCEECAGVIAPGDRYTANVSLYEGCWSTYRVCAPCMDGPVSFVEKNCGCVPWGGLHDHLVEVFRGYDFKHPGVKFRVGRMIVGLRRRGAASAAKETLARPAPGWLAGEIAKAKEEIAGWPEWLREGASFRTGGAS